MDWRASKNEIVGELRPTLKMAWPVVLAELGWMAMGTVDTMIVGTLGAEALGAVSVGSMLFFTLAVFGMGLLLGLDTIVAQAFGAGRLGDCRRALVQGVYLALLLSPLLMSSILFITPRLSFLGVNPEILDETLPYLRALNWGTFPLLLYAAFRRYLQAMGIVWPVMFALVTANLVNVAVNYVLVFGHLGFEAMGVEGSGWATTISRLYMAGVLIVYTIGHNRHNMRGLGPIDWRPDFARLGRLIALGWPAASHAVLEVGIFAAATALAAMMEPASLAAHQVVLTISSVTFMIPFGLGSTGAVRVGQAIGRGDPCGAALAGWTTFAMAMIFMTAAGAVLCLAPRFFLSAFIDDPKVIAIGVTLIFAAAGFQLFDGAQGVITGNLRGLGDTHTPMICLLIAHWVIGLPVGYFLAFRAGLGVLGLWLGLSTGLVLAGSVLLRVWVLKTRELCRTTLEVPLGEPAP